MERIDGGGVLGPPAKIMAAGPSPTPACLMQRTASSPSSARSNRTWHRPFTTFELAGLQSLVEPEEQLELDGLSDADWRERIGNAVPPDAAQAIASTMGQTLLLAWTGEGFMLSSVPIWVRPVAVALSIRPRDWEEGLCRPGPISTATTGSSWLSPAAKTPSLRC